MATVYVTRFAAYCGMYGVPQVNDDKADARRRIARRLRRARAEGCPVTIIEKGREWEIEEPHDAVLVPDFCGMLTLTERHTYEAPCGGKHSEEREPECAACIELYDAAMQDKRRTQHHNSGGQSDGKDTLAHSRC